MVHTVMTETLKSMMNEMLPLVEQEMGEVLGASPGASAGLFRQMMHYHMGWLDTELNPTQGNGGKRIRPVLTLLSAAAAGSSWQQALPAAAAVELLHNFTLIHDDIEDNSPTRRGRPTIWQLWGIPQAINAGDAMFAAAHIALYRLRERDVKADIIVRAAGRFDETCMALTLGQHRDMNFETEMDVTVDDYLHMIGGKTAALLALCGELGSLVAGAEEGAVQHYAEFGRNLGLAFQIKDDILGIWGDEGAIGKSSATDIETRKKSLPVLFGLSQSAEMKRLYQSDASDTAFVEQVVQILDDCGARDFANRHAEKYSQEALGHLEDAKPRGAAARALQELSSQLLARQH